ncbi:MAG TPA: efflux RND transporter periplasmic adaptor subunit, partial [Novosphingobium sp.]|nr:efflux RND transporter periplasmic adaptor subunit [Novosphingobium sp.]
MKKLCVLIAPLLLAACGEEAEKAVSAPPVDPALVVATPALAKRLQVAQVAQAPVSDTLRVAGQIDFDENRVARIGATVTGRVAAMPANIGQHVGKGAVLAQIVSTELSAQQLAYVRAKSAYELNRRNAERARALYAGDVISAAELQKRESEYQVSAAEMRAAADQLRLLGLPGAALGQLGARGALGSASQVRATMSGVVVERHLALGQVVQPSDALFVVADLSKVWAVAQVPEQQVRLVRLGEEVTLEIPALAGEKRKGRLVFIGHTVDPKTRTVLIRTELDNASGALKPSMLATMLVAGEPEARLVVPAAAVVRENNADHVFVVERAGAYRLRPVKLGEAHDGRRVVLSGLAAGEKIV